MANLKASQRELKKIKRNTERKKRFKTELKTVQKSAKKSILENSANVDVTVKHAISRIDSASSKGIIHKNAAARKKSRLMAFLNKLKGNK